MEITPAAGKQLIAKGLLSRADVQDALENHIVNEAYTSVDPEIVGSADAVIFGLYPEVFRQWIKDYQQYFKPGAMITDPRDAALRAVRMATEGLVRTVSGKDIPIRAESICVHGDGEKAVEFARTIRRELEEGGIRVHAF